MIIKFSGKSFMSVPDPDLDNRCVNCLQSYRTLHDNSNRCAQIHSLSGGCRPEGLKSIWIEVEEV